MSRTYRRKNGDKWWSDEDYTYIRHCSGKWIDNPTEEEVEWYKKDLISKYQERDAFFGKYFINSAVKKESNIYRRTSRKKEIKKITLENCNEFEYNRDKELLVKSICRYYH